MDAWNEGALEERLRALATRLGLKTGQLFGTLRVAATGRTVAPPLFGTLDVLGRDTVLRRIARAEEMLSTAGLTA